jgi:hypothetical protein
VYRESALNSATLAPIAAAVRQVLAGHEPYPAVVHNPRGDLLDANASAGLFLADVAPHLLEAPANVLRISLHPEGLAPNIVNLADWRRYLLDRLRRHVRDTADPALGELYDELAAYPGGESTGDPDPATAVAVPMRYRHRGTELSFVSIVATFGAPLDVTLSELAIEAFYPANDRTAAILRAG